MPSYVREGSVPHKRHIQFRRPDGGLYAEELFSTKGFESVYSLLYHLRPPTATLDVRPWEPCECDVRRKRAAAEPSLEDRLAPPRGRRSDRVADAVARQRRRRHLRREARDADGVFLPKYRRRRAALHSPRRRASSRPSSASSPIANTTISLHPDRHDLSHHPGRHRHGCSSTRLTGAVTIPRRYRNEFGQLEEHAPYYERDFRAPVLQAARRRSGRVRDTRHEAAAATRSTSCKTIHAT